MDIVTFICLLMIISAFAIFFLHNNKENKLNEHTNNFYRCHSCAFVFNGNDFDNYYQESYQDKARNQANETK